MEAKLDGFRMYKIKDRHDVSTSGRKYTAPVYVCGLPGDVRLLNDELALQSVAFDHLIQLDGKGRITDGQRGNN